MSKFKKKIRDYFYISKMQRFASLVLFSLVLALIAFYFYLPQLQKLDIFDQSSSIKEIRTFISSKPIKSVGEPQLNPVVFDPNTVSEQQLLEMGFTARQANTLLNYRQAGGRFSKNSDLKKIYSITDSLYKILEPYVVIRQIEIFKSQPEKAEPEPGFEMFLFNPNMLSDEKWKELGLNTRQITVINNYLAAGGSFEVKEDLKAIYSISDKDYLRLEEYIDLPYLSEVRVEKNRKPVEKPIFVEINAADSSELVKLKGIGPAYAKRIIKYRDLLGGYIRMEQLMEVFGMDTTRFFGFMHQVKIDTTNIRQIDLNHATFKELLRHPYLEYFMVKSIFDYKEENEGFYTVSELRNIGLIYDDLYIKIAPYLSIDDKNNQ